MLLSGIFLTPYLIEYFREALKHLRMYEKRKLALCYFSRFSLKGSLNSFVRVKSEEPHPEAKFPKKDIKTSWLRRQNDMKRRIRETCEKYNLMKTGNHLTWVDTALEIRE